MKCVEGLLQLHYRGVAHLDVKPDNILANSRGEIKMGDFNISRVLYVVPYHARVGRPEEEDKPGEQERRGDWNAGTHQKEKNRSRRHARVEPEPLEARRRLAHRPNPKPPPPR
jgi:serine/threonine protein kinase